MWEKKDNRDVRKIKNLYNLIFDNHYEISVGNMKFLKSSS